MSPPRETGRAAPSPLLHPATAACEASARIAELFRSEQRFLVLSHYRPDGDAVGSQLAVTLLLRDLGKQVDAWNDDPMPAKFRFLPHSQLIRRPPAEARDFDVVVAIDTSTWPRVGLAADRIASRKYFINIDHHVSNERYAEINWIVPGAPATGMIIYQFLRDEKFRLTREVATCLFAAISTDTGSFSFGNTTAEALRAAADLVDAGAEVGEISHHVYESYPFARVRLLQRALADLRLQHHGRIAYYWLTREMFELSGAQREDTEGLIDYARSIDGVVVAILFEELTEPGKVRISIRSKHARVDANAIARHFGGGGHREAAGARISGDNHDTERRVLETVSAALTAAGL